MDIVEREIKEFSHVYTAFVTVSETYQFNGLKQDLYTLHHWNHDAEPITSVAVPMECPPDGFSLDDFQSVLGFKDYGSLSVPEGHTSSQQLHKLLSRVVEELKTSRKMVDGSEITKAVVNHLEFIKTSSPEPASGQVAVRLLSISVVCTSKDVDDLFSAEERVWKWSKPSSPYVTSGSWSTNFGEVIIDGKWRAGKQISLLVFGVSRKYKESLFGGGKMPITVLRDLKQEGPNEVEACQ